MRKEHDVIIGEGVPCKAEAACTRKRPQVLLQHMADELSQVAQYAVRRLSIPNWPQKLSTWAIAENHAQSFHSP